MLHCRGGIFYTGHTDNLESRIGQHQSGVIPGFTRTYVPVTLVWSQDFPRGSKRWRPSAASRAGAKPRNWR
nr:GIY-YIG nuclease family protein [Sphingomonas sp. So64.6b]